MIFINAIYYVHMIITYNTLESFKLQFGDTVIACNPVSKQSSYPSTSFSADIVLVSIKHPDMNGVETASRGDNEPFVIDGPGEYEINDIYIRGFPTLSEYEGSTRNTLYLITLEDMHICFAGAISSPTLSSEILEELDDVDILFIPVGGEGVLSPADAQKLSVSLEPKIVIPMHYTKESLQAFLKEKGSTAGALDKLTIKKKEVMEKEGEIVILKPITQ